MAVERQFNSGDIEAIICRLKDIIAVSVVADAAGDLAEIHVLASGGRSPKQVVRDVESALMARLGVAVDHKKISVAQVADGSPRHDHSRLKFTDVSISLNGSHTEATVRLAKDGAICSGAASGTSSQTAQMKLIAEATLQAIAESGLTSAGITLEGVEEIPLGSRKVAVVLINMLTDRGEEPLAGSSVVKQDIWKGVVNATLDAVNRRLFATHER
jgi:hypothetical protein